MVDDRCVSCLLNWGHRTTPHREGRIKVELRGMYEIVRIVKCMLCGHRRIECEERDRWTVSDAVRCALNNGETVFEELT